MQTKIDGISNYISGKNEKIKSKCASQMTNLQERVKDNFQIHAICRDRIFCLEEVEGTGLLFVII